MNFSWIFTFFDSRPFQISSSGLKLYFITYYWPLIYFEVFSIYICLFSTNLCGPPKKAKKKMFWIFWIFEFFFSLNSRGGQLYGGGAIIWTIRVIVKIVLFFQTEFYIMWKCFYVIVNIFSLVGSILYDGYPHSQSF